MLLSIDIRTTYIYNQRGISIEPLKEHIKSIFRIDSLQVRGFHTASAIVKISVVLYQIMVYYNCKKDKSNPKSIKYIWFGLVDMEMRKR